MSRYSYYVSYTIGGTAFGFFEHRRDTPIGTFADVMAIRYWLIDDLRDKGAANPEQVVILNYQLLNAA